MRTIGVRAKGGDSGSNSDSECIFFWLFRSVKTNSTLPSNEREYDAFCTHLMLQLTRLLMV
jgi:hypothetical protein